VQIGKLILLRKQFLVLVMNLPQAHTLFIQDLLPGTGRQPVTEMGSLSMGSWKEEKDSCLLKWICH